MFTGQWYDEEIGQYYLRARQYDPAIYRFTSRDPVAGEFEGPSTLHRYLYCLNDPANRIDPTGMMSSYTESLIVWTIQGAIHGVVGGATNLLVQYMCGKKLSWEEIWTTMAQSVAIGAVGGACVPIVSKVMGVPIGIVGRNADNTSTTMGVTAVATGVITGYIEGMKKDKQISLSQEMQLMNAVHQVVILSVAEEYFGNDI